MSIKRWVKSPGEPLSIAPGYREAFLLSGYQADLVAFSNTAAARAALGEKWQALELLAEPSIFLSWAWIETWLEVVIEPAMNLLLIEVQKAGVCCGLALAAVCERGAGPFRSRVAFLNELPVGGRDLTMEKNGVLAHAGLERAMFAAVTAALARSSLRIDEIRASGIDQRYLSEPDDRAVAVVVTDERRRCWLLGKPETEAVASLDLTALLAQLSRSRRWQITRFQRLAEAEGGAVVLDEARETAEAARWFERLAELHTVYWQQQGKPGAFRNPRWQRFHWRLIERLLPAGQVQLVRIRAGEVELGYLYNLRQRDEMANIQSGFAYRADNRWRPGYLSHLLAADAAQRQGCRRYDLLMGDDDYKATIARPGAELFWLQIFPRRRFNQRLLLWRLLEAYRRLRTSSRPKAQGELRS
jgi:CelD/BcsL family acetyltransferase involved in cellulose biosynthesis